MLLLKQLIKMYSKYAGLQKKRIVDQIKFKIVSINHLSYINKHGRKTN